MKLALYSGGHDYENEILDQHLIELTGKEKPQITFIPSCSYLSHLDFQEFVDQYQKFNLDRFIHFPIDLPYTDVLKTEVFNSDIIHLSGGNTYYFIKQLRRKKLIPELRAFVKRGGILSGLSAGAIIMTRSIETAGFPSFDRDDNDDNVKNLKGMNLVDFEFFPHYRNSYRYDQEIIKYSRSKENPIYACPDGSGIIVLKDEIRFVGKSYCFNKGKKFLIK